MLSKKEGRVLAPEPEMTVPSFLLVSLLPITIPENGLQGVLSQEKFFGLSPRKRQPLKKRQNLRYLCR